MIFRILILGFLYFTAFTRVCDALEVYPFKGNIDFEKRQFQLSVDLKDEGTFTAQCDQTSPKDFHLSLDFDHFQTPRFNLTSRIESSLEIDMNETFGLKGQVWSQNSLLNFKPVHDLKGKFALKDNRLTLHSFSFGNMSLKGFMDVVKPYKLDVGVKLLSMEMDEFLGFWIKDKDFNSSGDVVGNIKVTGNLGNMQMRGDLQSLNGFVKRLEFDSIHLNLAGIYPHLEIDDSTITKADGMSFTIAGPIDLDNRSKLKKQIKALNIAPLVVVNDTQKEWTIKRSNEDEFGGKTELKYLLRKREDAISKGDEESDMLGVQRTVEF